MPRRKKGRQECFGRKNIMTLTCYTLCQGGRCSEDEQAACEHATEERLVQYGLMSVKVPEPLHT